MSLTRFSLTHRPVVLVATVIALLVGVVNFRTMSRREDPEITIRTCVITTVWPGASAEKIESLVTDPLEESINRIGEVDEIRSESRIGLSILFVDLEETTAAERVDQLYDEVRNKVAEVTPRLPEGCGTPLVDSDFGEVNPVVLAIYQKPPAGEGVVARLYDHRRLSDLAEIVEKDLETLESVAAVDVHGEQQEVITVEVDGDDWARIGLTAEQLRSLLEARNIVAPGGQLDTGSGRYSVLPSGELQRVDQIGGVTVGLRDGSLPIFLGDLPVRIFRGYEDPPRKLVRFQTADLLADHCLLLAVQMRSGRNVVDMGRQIEERIANLKATSLPPDLEVAIVNDLPRQVDTLLQDFMGNLLQAIGLVLIVAFVMMGLRPALIMAAAIPLCMIATIGVIRFLGVELEQFSIASLIIALGMVVDNAIVVSDNSVRLLNEGRSRLEAMIEGAGGLAIPVLTSTLTTVFAFLPMLTIEGNTGEYTRSLPIVVASTLLVSYVVAMMVTPIFCFWLLKPAPSPGQGKPPGQTAFQRRYLGLVRWCLDHEFLTLGTAVVAFLLSTLLIPLIGSQFFPAGQRDQFFVHVWLPEGSPIEATAGVCARVEQIVREEAPGPDGLDLENSVTFVGYGGPRLMLTQGPEQQYPNYGFMVVNTSSPGSTDAFLERVRARTERVPGARIDVQAFVLGPYIRYPIEFRILGPSAETLRDVAARAVEGFRETPGTLNPSDDWLNSAYRIDVEIQPEAANLAGVTNADVAGTMNTLISGQRLTTFREGDDQIAVLLRTPPEDRTDVARLGSFYVNGEDGKVPLTSIATVVPSWQPGVIRRKNGVRVIGIGSRVMEGHLSNDVSNELRPMMRALVSELPAGYRLEEGGEAEKTADSQAKITKAFGIAGLLIVLVLIAQYNSVLKPLIVLLAVPLALIGALLGLFVSGWALGFMPSLGIVSLAGVVVNNAIILIDFIEENSRAGTPLREAVAQAGAQRMKPIFLTTLTTVGGLLPLALFGGPMWAGMAWAMIFGLLLSTLLTLLVVPTIYVLFAEKLRMRV